MRTIWILVLTLLFVCSIEQSGAQERLDGVPPQLEPWVSWIRAGHPEWQCPWMQGGFQCSWPGTLTIRADEKRGSFIASIETLGEAAVPLPGSEVVLPHKITVTHEGGEPAKFSLALRDGVPSIELEAGRYTVRGEYSWDELPHEFAIPQEYGVVTFEPARAFKREGRLISFIDERPQDEADGVSLFLARRIVDSSPLTVYTRLQLQISGAVRSVNFGQVTLGGSRPVSVTSELTHQLAPNGVLSVQLRPGSYTVDITEVIGQPVTTLTAPEPNFVNWPAQETWAWIGNPSFRTVEISGGEPVSAKLTQLPPEWQDGATYIVERGKELTLKEIHRGEEREQENELTLARNLWLDADGSAFTVSDYFSGTMRSKFRLDALAELQLGRAEVDNTPAFITQSPETGLSGVELRNQAVNARAVSRLSRTKKVSAVGWNTTVDSLSGNIYLPPSWKLLHISQASNHSQTWVNSWDLLDVFVCMLLIIGTAKLFGWRTAILVSGVTVFAHAEFLEPRFALIHLLLAGALWSLVKTSDGWMREASKLYLFGVFAIWLAEVLTFSKLQLTQLLFPQLEAGTRFRTASQDLLLQLEENFFLIPLVLLILFPLGALQHVRRTRSKGQGLAWPALIVLGAISIFAFLLLMGSSASSTYRGVAKGRYPASQSVVESPSFDGAGAASDLAVLEESKNMPVQRAYKERTDNERAQSRLANSGPALPSWQWRSFAFSVAGPVPPEAQVSFVLLSPGANRVLSALRIVILVLLTVTFWRRLGLKTPHLPAPSAAVGAVLLVLAFPAVAQAELPDSSTLKELEARLAKEVCQGEQCSTLEDLEIAISGDAFSLRATAVINGEGAVPLPGPLSELPIRDVVISGRPTSALRSDGSGFLWVRLPSGKSVVEARGTLSSHSAVTLQFAMKPFHTTFSAEDWFAEGLSPSGSIAGSLRIIPRSKGEETTEQKAVLLPTWFLVSRSVSLGDDYTTETTIHRLGDRSSLAQASFGLLPGERLLSGAAVSEDGIVTVRFAPDIETVSLEGVLPANGSIELAARAADPSDSSISEQWRVRCASFLRCSSDGVRPQQIVEEGKQVYVWQPFPGEKVTVQAKALSGVPGDTLTVDASSHDVRWGTTLQEGSVQATLRVTQQTPYTVTVPPGALLKRNTLNGVEGSAVEAGEKVTFLLNPGQHQVQLDYSLPRAVANVESAPPIQSSAPLHNAAIKIHPSSDRWIVWLRGPAWGPAVLFWAKLLVLIAFFLAMARADLLPVSRFGAVLLAVGVATLPLIFMFIPLLWLFVLHRFALAEASLRRMNVPLRLSAFGFLTFLSAVYLYAIVRSGLIIEPPMLVVGNSSTSSLLSWFADHPGREFPQPTVFSLPLWCWRVVMLAWSTWLAIAVLSWLKRTVEVMRALAHDPQLSTNSELSSSP